MVHIAIAAPVRPSSRSGNDVTTARWAELLGEAGHRVSVVAVDEAATVLSSAASAVLSEADLLIALHARRSAAAVTAWRRQRGAAPLVVALTGTDLYVDLPDDVVARASLDAADAIIALQAAAVDRLADMSSPWSDRAVVVHQSVAGMVPPHRPTAADVRVVVLAHLRPVKDPLLCARAAARLPVDSRVRVHHAGGGGDATLRAEIEAEARTNDRYRWHGEVDAGAARELLASAHVLACTSRAEGGANVVSEALAMGVPVIGTRIDGNVGLLGEDHPGLVPVGDVAAMTDLLHRIETEPVVLRELADRTAARRHLTDRSTERAALDAVVARLR